VNPIIVPGITMINSLMLEPSLYPDISVPH
jgi:hypothetical protein